MVIYDIEIKRAILGKNEQPIDGVEYCEGWNDHAGMGISCICAYDYREDRYRVFTEDNMQDFALLADSRDTIIGFNNIKFDNMVIAAANIPLLDIDYLNKKSYDILAEIRDAGGGWCSLDATVKVNDLGSGKTGNGKMAPVWYQEGRIGKLVDYCIADVWNTKKLLDKIIQSPFLEGSLISPQTGQVINIKKPLITKKGK